MFAYTKQIRNRIQSSFMISIIIHIAFVMIILFYPRTYPDIGKDETIPVEWVKGLPKPELKQREQQLKQPTKPKMDPERKVGREAKMMLASPNKVAEVIEKGKRPVSKGVEMITAEPAKFWVRSDADLPDAEASNISRMVSAPGYGDGDGRVTGWVRAGGHGRGGLGLIERYGTGDGDGSGGEGDGGGGGFLGIPEGWDKIGDQLGMIDFIRERSGPQQVVYCLDVSASMSAAGLRKLELSIESIRDALLMLREEDHFNIITFASTASKMSDSMLPATLQNIEKSFKYLRKFNPRSTKQNLGTDLLGAVDLSLQFNPSVIVLVTDGLPTPGRVQSRQIETNPDKIIKAVQTRNVNHASIYVVGLEMTLRKSPGASLLIALAKHNNGRVKLIGGKELVKYIQ